MTFRLIPRFSFGIEYNPRSDDVSALANFVAMTETEKRPALIFGTSSDRIGTPEGQAYFFTLSKAFAVDGWTLAPYAGASFGTFEDELKAIGGFHLRPPRTNFAATFIHDGKNFHPTVEYRFLERHVLSLLWVDTTDLGLSYSVAF